MFILFLCAACLLTFTGCWSRVEPKNLAMVNSILYDLNDEGQLAISIEIINTSSQGGSGSGGSLSNEQTSALIIEEKGETASRAGSKANNCLEKVVFAGLNKARIFSEKLSVQGLAPTMDFITRDFLTDETPFMVVVVGNAPKEIYQSSTGMSDMVGNFIDRLYTVGPIKSNRAVFVRTLDFMKDFYLDGKEPVMGLAQVKKEEAIENQAPGSQKSQKSSDTGVGSSSSASYKETNAKTSNHLVYEGLAAFKQDKLVGYMNGTETMAYNLITNNFGYSSLIVPVQKDPVAFSMENGKNNVKTVVDENGQVTINLDMKVRLSIRQINNLSLDIRKEKVIQMLEQLVNRHLQEEIQSAVLKAQKQFQSDIFGFGVFVHAQHPKEFQKMKNNWNSHFANAKVNVKVASSISREGKTRHPFAMEDRI